jgi:putative ABC transport system permease protein
MRVILWKLISDFRLAKGKLLLLIVAASLSGWGISTVVYSYFMSERDFQENFVQTYPADMTLVIDNYTPALEAAILADDNVVDIERREVISARIKNRHGAWIPVLLFAVEDLDQMRFDVFNIPNEANRKPGNILVEQNAYNFLHADQSSIELQFRNSTASVIWEVAGKAHDARQAPATMEGLVYAYATSLDKIEPYLTQGRRRLLIKTNVSTDRKLLEQVKDRLSITAEASGGRMVGIKIPNPGEHVHQGIVDGISFLQRSGGMVLSIMGITLLSLILLTWIFPQVFDIGVMKALGGSTKDLFVSYTIVLGILLIMGLGIGLPMGYMTAMAYNRFVAFLQNFEIVTAILPFYTHLLTVLIGLLIPLSFGIVPILKGVRTSVNEAMTKTFYIPRKGFFQLSQRLISNSRLKYGLNNLLRQSQRTMLTILLIAVGVALFFTASNVDYSIRTDLTDFSNDTRYEVVVTMPTEMNQKEVSFLDQLPVVKSYAPMKVSGVTYIPPTLGYPELSYVRVLSTDIVIDDKYLQRGQIDKDCISCIYVSGEDMRAHFAGASLGDSIALTYSPGVIKSFVFSGVIRDLAVISSPFFIYDNEATSTFNALALTLNGDLSLEEVNQASNAVDDAFMNNGINLAGRSTVKGRIAAIMNHLEPTFIIIKVMGVFTIVMGLFGLIIVLKLTIQERTREIGIMASIGSSYRKISMLFTLEFLLISSMAIVIGGLLAIPAATSLIDVIADTVIRHPVSFKNDFIIIGCSVGIILILQIVIISIYNRLKIGQNTRELLDHNF